MTLRIGLATKWAAERNTGVGVYTRQLLLGLRALQESRDISVTSIHRGKVQRREIPPDQTISFRGLPGPLWLLSQNRTFRKMATRFDVVHEPYLGLLGAFETPRVVTIHDTMPIAFPELVPKAFRFYFAEVMPRVLDEASAIIVDSKATRDDVMRYYGANRSKVHVVPLGADRLPELMFPPENLLSGHDLHMGQYYHTVGTGPTKNLETTLRAYAALASRSKSPPALAIVGNVPTTLESVLQEACRAGGDVRVEQKVDEVFLATLFAGAIATVQPSLSEGFGLPAVESMRAGTPAIVSSEGAAPEVCGTAALQVAPFDVEDLCDAMTLVNDPEVRPTLVSRGLAHAEKFTWERTARRTLAVYDLVVGRASAPLEGAGAVTAPAVGAS